MLVIMVDMAVWMMDHVQMMGIAQQMHIMKYYIKAITQLDAIRVLIVSVL